MFQTQHLSAFLFLSSKFPLFFDIIVEGNILEEIGRPSSEE